MQKINTAREAEAMTSRAQITSRHFYMSVTKLCTVFRVVDKGGPGPCPQGAYNLVTQT